MAAGLLIVAILAASGCTSAPWWPRRSRPDPIHNANPTADSYPVDPRETEAPSTSPKTETARNEDGTGGSESTALKAFIAELEEHPEISLADRNEILQQLHQTEPSLLEGVIRQYRANLTLRRQQKEKERELADRQTTADAIKIDTNLKTPPKPSPVAASAPDPPDTSSPAVDAPKAEVAQPTVAAGLVAAKIPFQSEPPRPAAKPTTPDTRAAEPPALSVADRLVKTARAPHDESEADVVAASFETKPPADWQDQLTATIGALESSVNKSPELPEEISDHARLRLLCLAAQRRDDALRPIPTLDSDMTEFWNKEVFGLATLLDTAMISDPVQRLSEAKVHFEEATGRLGEAGPLVVRNLAFITKVVSYGVYTTFESYEFTPSQRVGLYVEIDNFTSQERPQGFHTSLKSSYQILDSRGQRVAADEFAPNQENCRNRRRDYFIFYEFSMPERIYPGEYTLQLTVTDVNSQKVGQSKVQFYIKDGNER